MVWTAELTSARLEVAASATNLRWSDPAIAQKASGAFGCATLARAERRDQLVELVLIPHSVDLRARVVRAVEARAPRQATASECHR